jgi:MFS transporter, PAT family, beta-lactamase induction signal transducer AmpG
LKALKPAVFIPTLYFIEGLPYALVVYVSVVFYKNLGESLVFIGQATSLFYLPWVLKFAWAPMVDLVGTKRGWIVGAQIALTLLFAALFSLSIFPTLSSAQVMTATLCCFSLMAVISATQDVAIDGYYLESLNKEQQSYFVGVRNAVYKMAILFGQSVLVFFVGILHEQQHLNYVQGWSMAFGVCGAICALAALLHYFGLPKSQRLQSANASENKASLKTFLTVFLTFFDQAKIFWIVIYILTFRLGDALVLKMAYPFLQDDVAKGGLAYSNIVLSQVTGVGIGFLLLGGILGGIVVSKYGLKRTLMPTAIFQNLSILLYYFLAQFRPDFAVVATFNAIEQFGYGLGTAAYTVFLLRTVKSEYKAGHYAIATALMALGIMLPGYFSGALCLALGYKTFFLVSFLAAIPGMMTILLLPLDDK